MIILISLSLIFMVLDFLVAPANIITWAAVFTTMSFVLRPFGIYVKVSKILPVEGLIAFIAIMGSFLLKTFSLKTYLLLFLLRGLFFLVVLFDDTQYVYVKEEEEV